MKSEKSDNLRGDKPLKNEQRELFARAVVSGKGNSDAYQKAGYKSKTKGAISTASNRLRKDPVVKARIDHLMSKSAKRAEVNAALIAEELSKIGFANILDYIKIDDDGLAHVDLFAMTRDQAAAIGEVTVERRMLGDTVMSIEKVNFKLINKLGALDKLGKMLGMWSDVDKNTDNVIFVLSDKPMSQEDWMKEYGRGTAVDASSGTADGAD